MLNGIVSGAEKAITRIPMQVGGSYKEGWEVRDNQDRLIWGREDELQTVTGTLPFKGYGLPVKVKSLLGNTQQTGTPTPDAPIMPEFVGVRTSNLWNPDSRTTNQVGQLNWGVVLPAGTYTITNNSSVTVYFRDGLDSTTATRFANEGETETKTASTELVAWCNSSQPNIMLNSGSTALPYEPFGYKIPITCAGQTVPVYLGEVPTVRRVRKLVLTGEENWSKSTAQTGRYNLSVSDYMKSKGDVTSICTHFDAVAQQTGGQYPDKSQSFYAGSDATRFMFVHDADIETLADLKTYLAQQYAAGTPVTVWYVTSKPETTISNEPLCKISTYADELSSEDAGVTIPTIRGQNTLTVDTTLAPSSLTVSVHAKKIHYGFKIDKSVDDSEDAVIYTHDAVTMTPAHMNFTNDRFDYGSWGNAFFVRDCYPVALNLDGTEAYRLDPDDYTKKMDGTPSDIFYALLTEEPSDWSTQWKQYYTKSGDEYVLNGQSEAPTFTTDTYYKLTYSSSFTGNFMMAFPKVWFYRHEDSQYNYIEISNHRLSDDWKCYAHINANGQEVDFIYLPLFKGVIKDSKLRSLPGQIPQGNTTATTEVNAATALGSRWQIWDHSSAECINDLLTLMSKSIDSQGRFGQGRSTGYEPTDTVTYGKLQTGTLINKGKFHGYSATTKEVKVFGLEGFWANRWDRLQGMLLAGNVWKIKMTPPYNFTGTNFVTFSDAEVPSGNGYLSKVQTSEYGSIPASISNGSSTKYFKDYFYKAATGTRVALRGGACSDGVYAGFRYVSVSSVASSSAWHIGASPVYK